MISQQHFVESFNGGINDLGLRCDDEGGGRSDGGGVDIGEGEDVFSWNSNYLKHHGAAHVQALLRACDRCHAGSFSEHLI